MTQSCHSVAEKELACCPDIQPVLGCDGYEKYEEPKCLSWLLLGPRLLKASAESSVQVIKSTFNNKEKACCEIPETGCPPRCVGGIDWLGMPGDTLHHEIYLTNTGDKKRTFELTPLPFACSDESVKVTPNKKELAPGESLKAKVSFKIPEAFAGSHLQTEILLRGAYEQCIVIDLCVKSREESCSDIQQGEVPTQVKAHHWYDHFQCEKPCFESLDQENELTTRTLDRS